MFPDGYFIDGMLYFGHSLSRESYLSKGVSLTVPDLRTSGLEVLRDLLSGNSRLLTSLFANKMALQVHWSVEDDFATPLDRYDRETEEAVKRGNCNQFTILNRKIRHAEACDQLARGILRRERVYLYFGSKCDSLEAADLTSIASYEAFLQQQAVNFQSRLSILHSLYAMGRVEPMGDKEHYLHWMKVLNPSRSVDLGQPGMADRLKPDRSILQNCCHSQVDPMRLPRHKGAVGLEFDGMLHTVFVMRERPAGTRMGDMLPLFGAATKGVTVVMNIYPQDIEREVEITRKEREEWLKYVNDPKSYGAHDEVARLGNKISFLQKREILPFRVLWIVKVSGRNADELNERCVRVKSALSSMDGLEYHQVNEPTQATNLFHETLPGWMGSKYRDWDVYWENKNLRDMLPISSSFSGHLDEEPMALYHTPSGGLAAVRILANGTPQHTCCVGVNGSGKTSVTIDLLTQTGDKATYRAIFEEGLAYATYAQLTGMQSIVPRAGAPYTLNPFDTMGLPLSDENMREVSAVCMKLIGKSANEDQTKGREALLVEYIAKLFQGAAKSYLQQDEERSYRVSKLALLLSRRQQMMPTGSSQLDAYAELKEIRDKDPGRIEEELAALDEGDVIAFANNPATRSAVMRAAFTEFRPEDYPQYSQLWSLMKNGRMSHHRSGGVSEELDRLVSAMARGKAIGGTIGCMIDGVTNVNLAGSGVHVDYSFLPEGELKEVAGFLFPSRVRQYIITRPRSELKQVVWEELRRLLRIPGAAEMVKETLAQFRKYRAWALLCFQTPAQIEEVDPALLDLILSECKQHLILRLNSRTQVDRIGNVIGLPEAARQDVLAYELVEHQKRGRKGAYMTLFAKEGDVGTCGTLVNFVNPYMLYVASSNGDVFDKRARALAAYANPFDGVVAEVNKNLAQSGTTPFYAAVAAQLEKRAAAMAAAAASPAPEPVTA